jgi:SpoIID/LytB domain protein
MFQVNSFGADLPNNDSFSCLRTPTIRVGLLEGYKRLDFHLRGSFTITGLKGDTLFSEIKSELRWRARVEKAIPAEFVYRVLLKTFLHQDDAFPLESDLKSQGYQAETLEIGGEVKIDGEIINDTRKYRVVVGKFHCEGDCQPLLEEFAKSYSAKVIEQLVEPAVGKLEFYDAEYDRSASVESGFRLLPLSHDGFVTIRGVKVGEGFHWEGSQDLDYPGVIEIRIDESGGLMAINELPLDLYLKGVVPAEMPPAYPYEALKAQAVAARSEVLSQLGTKHTNDPYDLCAGVHCQVYSGLNLRSSKSDSAVTETLGEVLVFQGRVCDAVYSSVCGGHTENKENVWNTPKDNYLQGVFDSDSIAVKDFDLTQERDFKRWVDSKPKVFCNVSTIGAPSSLNGAVKYFNWEETYTRQELEEIILQKTGAKIGTFFGIEPLKRGVSGRLIEMEILGSSANHKVRGELNIRRALSKTHLKSSAFYVTLNCNSDSVPIEITLHGTGWGHGVGMCQVGSAMMAFQGYTNKQILEHYYPGTQIRIIYPMKPTLKSMKELQPEVEIIEE